MSVRKGWQIVAETIADAVRGETGSSEPEHWEEEAKNCILKMTGLPLEDVVRDADQ